MNLWNYKGEQNNITEALQLRIPPHAVISLTGAGGKTSLMTAWARELASQGRHTVITTTTHLQHPLHFKDQSESPYRGIPVLFPEDFTKNGSPDTEAAAEKLEELLAEHGTAMVVSADPARPKKLMQPATEIMERVFRTAAAGERGPERGGPAGGLLQLHNQRHCRLRARAVLLPAIQNGIGGQAADPFPLRQPERFLRRAGHDDDRAGGLLRVYHDGLVLYA